MPASAWPSLASSTYRTNAIVIVLPRRSRPDSGRPSARSTCEASGQGTRTHHSQDVPHALPEVRRLADPSRDAARDVLMTDHPRRRGSGANPMTPQDPPEHVTNAWTRSFAWLHMSRGRIAPL